MKSWKTTVTGLVTIILAVGNAALALIDDNAATTVNWEGTITAITLGLGLMAARDNKVTSEAAGAKPPQP